MRKVKNIQCHRPHTQFKASHGHVISKIILNMIHSNSSNFSTFPGLIILSFHSGLSIRTLIRIGIMTFFVYFLKLQIPVHPQCTSTRVM